jgi:hypothetical protein
MLTIFCSPKPFRNEANWNQRNALRSWKAIHPDVEIFVFGSPVGAAEAASEINAVLVPEVECSPSGAPSFNAMQRHASMHGRFDLQIYVNCDILLNATLARAMLASYRRFERFLMVGERLDLAQGTTIDVRQPDWAESLEALALNKQLTTHGPTGVDYFGFARGIWEDLPPVYMGRALCDQALLHHCLRQSIPIVDSTQAVLAIHQFHDYRHVQGGRPEVFFGRDRSTMAQEHHLGHSVPIISDADWMFAGDGTIIKGRRRILRRWELVLRYQCRLDNVSLFFRALQYLGGKRNLHPENFPINGVLASWSRFLGSS